MPDKQRETGSCMVCGKPSGERKLCYNCDKTPEFAAPAPVPPKVYGSCETLGAGHNLPHGQNIACTNWEKNPSAPAPVLTPPDYLDIVRQPPLNKPPESQQRLKKYLRTAPAVAGELEALKLKHAKLVKAVGEAECLPECDEYFHEEKCPNASTAMRLVELTEKLAVAGRAQRDAEFLEAQRQSQLGWARVKEIEIEIRAELCRLLTMNPEETLIGGIRNLAQIAITAEDTAEQLEAEHGRFLQMAATAEKVNAALNETTVELDKANRELAALRESAREAPSQQIDYRCGSCGEILELGPCDETTVHVKACASCRFSPLGDNHHNANVCPHCRELREASPEAPDRKNCNHASTFSCGTYCTSFKKEAPDVSKVEPIPGATGTVRYTSSSRDKGGTHSVAAPEPVKKENL